MEFFTISMLNGLSYGLLLFMLSSGLTLIFSMMGVLNFAHASFYMLGAYVGYSVARLVGFWPALVLAPLVVGALGAAFERTCLRKVHKYGHVPELLVTFGLSYVILELVQLIWGRTAVEFLPPEVLRGPAFTLVQSSVDGLSVLWGAAPAAMSEDLRFLVTVRTHEVTHILDHTGQPGQPRTSAEHEHEDTRHVVAQRFNRVGVGQRRLDDQADAGAR